MEFLGKSVVSRLGRFAKGSNGSLALRNCYSLASLCVFFEFRVFFRVLVISDQFPDSGVFCAGRRCISARVNFS